LEEGQIRSFEVNEQDDVGDKIPMHYAAETGNLDIFKTLFEASGKVAKPDEEGWNALHYASKDGHRNIVNYILKYGKESIKEKWEKEDEIDKRDDDRRTPLFLASQFGSLEVAQALILNGADIDVEDRNENTVLDVAGNSKMADFIRVQHHMRLGDAEGIINFVRNGGNQNVQDRNGDTLLIHLIRLRDFEKVVEILELGADKYIENHQGHNAITVAIQTDHRFYAHLTGGNSINPDDSGPIISARCYSKRERERILTAQNSDEVFSDGRRFFTNKCILQGEIRDESRITLATVNGVTIPLYGDGSFEFELELVNGNNLVEIYARDRFGNPTNYPLNLVAEIPDVLPDIQNWYKRQKAIVVGINRYRNRAIEPLENAENDARAVAKLFRDLGYDVTLLLGSDATEERILDEMEKAEVDIDTSESNSFIFYYAGHGQGITIEKTGARHGYILPYNSTVSLSNPTYSSYAKSNAISIDRLQNTASEMPQNHVALLLDSCFSGLATQLRGNERKIVRGNEHYKNLLNKKSSFVLTAGDDEPVSDGSDNHSPFAQGVINALEDRMADEDGDGFATFTDLALYVKNYVQRVTKYEQKPQIINFGKEEGETIIKLK
jgi:ankyrin repeat protein